MVNYGGNDYQMILVKGDSRGRGEGWGGGHTRGNGNGVK